LGNLWIADTGNARVRKVTGLAITTSSADLSITITASASSVLAGTNATYSIVVTNDGGSAATSVLVTDTLPAPLTLVSCNSTAGGVCSGSLNNINVSFSSLANGASATITLVATANASVAAGTVVLNTASAASPLDDPNQSNNSSTVAVIVQQSQTISFTGPSNQVFGMAPFGVSATATAGLAVRVH
jgi:uncharacterized repeat protein (TIGR01451 family)